MWLFSSSYTWCRPGLALLVSGDAGLHKTPETLRSQEDTGGTVRGG